MDCYRENSFLYLPFSNNCLLLRINNNAFYIAFTSISSKAFKSISFKGNILLINKRINDQSSSRSKSRSESFPIDCLTPPLNDCFTGYPLPIDIIFELTSDPDEFPLNFMLSTKGFLELCWPFSWEIELFRFFESLSKGSLFYAKIDGLLVDIESFMVFC